MSKRSKNSESGYDALIENLVRENNSLKKKISRLRKYAASDQLDDETDAAESFTEGKKKSGGCPCGGELKRWSLLDRVFDVCQSCKQRFKVSESVLTLSAK